MFLKRESLSGYSHRQKHDLVSMVKQRFSILIVGAGIAGLAAAITLAEQGNLVTILEDAPKVRIELQSW
jgi:heterodisulfide reductase subunit A-like polyferredoxin